MERDAVALWSREPGSAATSAALIGADRRPLRGDGRGVDVATVDAHAPDAHEDAVAHGVLGLHLEAVVGVAERSVDVELSVR